MVNGQKVRQPVFLLGAPHAGTQLLAVALKRSPGFHLTLGHSSVLPVVHAFTHTPSIARGRPEAAATVLRDAFAQAWQVGPRSCLDCSQLCRDAAADAAGTGAGTGAGTTAIRPCADQHAIRRYADASAELLYCAEPLIAAFPDARLVQIIRDGRDTVAAMLSDPQALSWFRPGAVKLDAEPAHPLLGVDSPADHGLWREASLAGKCALRWRGAVRLAASLRARFSAGQLVTLRYEEMVRQPRAAASTLSAFLGAQVSEVEAHIAGTPMEQGASRRLLARAQLEEVERLAGEELRRVGYGASPPGA